MTTPIPTRQRLTNRVLDEVCALPPEARARRYWDTMVPDLCVQFNAKRTGTPSFMLRYTKLDGSDGDYSIGPVDKVAIDSARAEARKALNDLHAHGIDPVQARRDAREEAKAPKLKSFEQLAEAFIESKAAQRPGLPPLEEVYFLRHYVLPVLGSRKFDKITTQCVMDTVTSIKNEVGARRRRKGANGKTTANACHRAIKRVYKWACNKDLAIRNPADFAPLFDLKREKRRGRLSEERFGLFWGELTGRLYGMARPKAGLLAILLFMLMLQRPIDVARAKRVHIDLTKRMWVIPEDYTKTGYEYHIPLSEPVVRLLRVVMSMTDSEFLFPSDRENGPYLHEQGLTDGWIRVRRRLLETGRLDEKDVELYDARRFGRTQIRAKLGFSNDVAEAVINHVAQQHEMSRLYDVEEMLPHMIDAHAKWAEEVEEMTKGDLSRFIEHLESTLI
ncbi:MAG: integrase arm-type DNA-binding domain-containing protein [Brevundimonas sp.]|uniref:tyrosine-type recombinase/integrase n=1 Tax=Brevundimonas sp. TaxID=1871086 RepID=UPI0025C6243D|nr:integrase arm-type DNA-binding domain-containing protein [Brevundimonas sp.]MBX3477662.1 integrase arm-type DNA-binding domain-containing protein [Brevundimonas sp.]